MEMRSTYMGPNSATRYYRNNRGLVLALFCVVFGLAVVFAILLCKNLPEGVSVVEMFFSEWYFAFWLLIVPLYLAGYLIYGVFQSRYYNNVLLTDVQRIVPQVGDFMRRRFNLVFEVVKDGQKMTVKSQRFFDCNNVNINEYAGRPCTVGYDSKRKHWVVI